MIDVIEENKLYAQNKLYPFQSAFLPFSYFSIPTPERNPRRAPTIKKIRLMNHIYLTRFLSI
ncbi:MAG: hypothetical protein AYK19_19880 [Theionarchaea archaeon DG-70-1]|nr:MAG: hypothetical protein AYK19_19880 [Theionarchaea archaeon DG-70-1]